MPEKIQQMIQEFERTRKIRRRAYAALTAMAIAVSLGTGYALMQPAVTMTGDPVCGMEEHVHGSGCYDRVLVCTDENREGHSHSEECYPMEYICGQDAVEAHSHGEECYSITCGYEETEGHTHSDACYGVACGVDATDGHTHSDACYGVACGKDATEGHSHGDSCYELQSRLICSAREGEGHSHSDSCYGNTCGKSESAGHSHDDSCYSEKSVLSCGQSESSGHSHGDGCYTTERKLSCGKSECEAHTHDAGCIGLTCGKSEYAAHTHDDGCYVQENVLVCKEKEIAPHTHDESCTGLTCDETECAPHAHDEACNGLICGEEEHDAHAHDETCSSLTCTLEETEGHTHTAECEGGRSEIPACGKEECEPYITEHVHDETCYETRLVCELAEHVHGDECYEIEIVEEVFCGYEEHTHAAACYSEPVLVCEDATEGHEHGEECYTSELICELPEHVHEDACYEPIPEVYCGLEEHTHDDACYGEPVLVCEDATEGHEHGEECYTSELICELPEHIHEDACYMEISLSDYVAVYEKISNLPENAVLVLAEEIGDEDNEFKYGDNFVDMTIYMSGVPAIAQIAEVLDEEEVAAADVEVAEEPQEEPSGLILAVIPVAAESEKYTEMADYAQEISSEEDELYNILAYEFYYFCDGIELDVTGCEILAEVSPKEETLVLPEEMPAPDVQVFVEDAVEPSGDEPVAEMPTLMANTVVEEPAEEPKAEQIILLSVLQDDNGEVSETDSMLVDPEEPSGTMLTIPMMSNVMALAVSGTANPSFMVQFYADIETVKLVESKPSTGKYLPVIDTSKKTGDGKLPINGTKPQELFVPMKQNGTKNEYTVQTVKEVTQVYADQTYTYVEAPNLSYFNRLYENGNYKLVSVNIKNPGESTFTTYTNWNELHFTNREANAKGNTLLIKQGTVIKLVYDTSTGEYDNSARFYDYDISTTKNSNGYIQTAKYGINSDSNYDPNNSGTRLAFGNENTGTNYGSLKWTDENGVAGNKINGYNRVSNNYNGCAFGLVSSLGSDNLPIFAKGLNVPKLYGSTNQEGKHPFTKSSLSFARSGDAYTLSSVIVSDDKSNNELSGLQKFNHPNYDNGNVYHSHILTNNFWPMDNNPGHDGLFGLFYGYESDGDPITNQRYNSSGRLPVSDDGKNHNSYFGMDYAVNFKLTADYVGPLDYLFFGDDDMWVFLTKPNGDVTLVCDIGGVHSSVGEYVDLWDYIERDVDLNDKEAVAAKEGTYKLSFFYNERGASGSTCYMRFTLPSVSSATPDNVTSNLKVEKEVVGPGDPNQEFHFSINFTDANGNDLLDDYAYNRYDVNGEKIETDIIVYNGGEFNLKNGEYIVIRYLPVGTKYTIIEDTYAGYSTTNEVNGGEVVVGPTATGSIDAAQITYTVHYTNTTGPVLPSTGGIGTTLYTTLGGLLMLSAVLLLEQQRRRRSIVE